VLIIVGGFIGAGLTGYYVDKTRKYIHLAKLFALFYGLSSALCLIVSQFSINISYFSLVVLVRVI